MKKHTPEDTVTLFSTAADEGSGIAYSCLACREVCHKRLAWLEGLMVLEGSRTLEFSMGRFLNIPCAFFPHPDPYFSDVVFIVFPLLLISRPGAGGGGSKCWPWYSILPSTPYSVTKKIEEMVLPFTCRSNPPHLYETKVWERPCFHKKELSTIAVPSIT